jgi:hypothetical protein
LDAKNPNSAFEDCQQKNLKRVLVEVQYDSCKRIFARKEEPKSPDLEGFVFGQ